MPKLPASERSVAATLRRGFSVVLVCLLLAGIAGTAALVVVVRGFEHVNDHEVPLLAANDDARQILTDAQSNKRGFQLTGEEAFQASYRPAQGAFNGALDRMKALDTDGRLNDLIVHQRRAGRAWFNTAKPSLEAPAGSEQTVSASSRTTFADFRAVSAATDRRIREDLDAGLMDARRLGGLTGAALLVLVLIAFLVGSRVARKASYRVTAPLGRLVSTLERITTGEFAARSDTGGPTEVAAVADATNRLAAAAQRLTSDHAEQLEGAQRVHSLAAAMHPLLDVDRVLEVAVQHLAELGHRADARRVNVETLDELSRIWAGDAPPPDDTGSSGNLLPLILEAATERRVVALCDATSDARLDAEARAFCAALGVRAALTGATSAGPQELVIISVHETTHARTWTDAEVSRFDASMREIATAVANAVAFEKQRQVMHRLEQLDREKTDFMSNVSHELRTPLTSIMGYGELLTEGDAGPLNDDQRGLLRTISRNSNRLLDLIEDLLLLSRLEGGALAMSDEPVQIATLVEDAASALRPIFAARPVALTVDAPAHAGHVLGDSGQLERVVLNLLSNAAKFTPPGGEVSIEVTADADTVTITVTDTGIGIPDDELDLLFNRFYRTTTTRDHAIQGTGLGLAISQTIAHRHGGRITADSQQDAGSRFQVHLPLADAVSTEGNASCQLTTTSPSS